MARSRHENGKRVVDNWNRAFRALSAEPRRQLVVELLDAEPAETVPLPESATNPNLPTDIESIRRTLHHQHLPLLADMGFVEWERDPFVASRGDRFEEVAVVFEALQSFADGLPDSLVIGCRRLEEERRFSKR